MQISPMFSCLRPWAGVDSPPCAKSPTSFSHFNYQPDRREDFRDTQSRTSSSSWPGQSTCKSKMLFTQSLAYFSHGHCAFCSVRVTALSRLLRSLLLLATACRRREKRQHVAASRAQMTHCLSWKMTMKQGSRTGTSWTAVSDVQLRRGLCMSFTGASNMYSVATSVWDFGEDYGRRGWVSYPQPWLDMNVCRIRKRRA